MDNITASIRHCLGNLTNFTGRDRPGQFWPYTIVLLAAQMIVMPYTIGLGVLVMLLLFAATVRRLHDRDWSGWWVLLVVVAKAIGLVSGYWMMDLMAADPNAIMNHMGAIQAAAWLPWVAYIVLLVQLVQSGEPTDNRFGPPPE